jgi:2-dehydro-3-deoxygluconokinase
MGDADELAVLAGTSAADATQALLDGGCRVVVERRGAQGAVASDHHHSCDVASMAWAVIDTVGAGDAFTAGFLTATLEALEIDAALERASLVAAHVVATPGDVEGIPGRASVIDSTRRGR